MLRTKVTALVVGPNTAYILIAVTPSHNRHVCSEKCEVGSPEPREEAIQSLLICARILRYDWSLKIRRTFTTTHSSPLIRKLPRDCGVGQNDSMFSATSSFAGLLPG